MLCLLPLYSTRSKVSHFILCIKPMAVGLSMNQTNLVVLFNRHASSHHSAGMIGETMRGQISLYISSILFAC